MRSFKSTDKRATLLHCTRFERFSFFFCIFPVVVVSGAVTFVRSVIFLLTFIVRKKLQITRQLMYLLCRDAFFGAIDLWICKLKNGIIFKSEIVL